MDLLEKYEYMKTNEELGIYEWLQLRHLNGRKIELRNYQERLIKDKSQKITWIAGRRIGKTVTCALKALYTAENKPSQNIVILVPYQGQARLMSLLFRETSELSGDRYTLLRSGTTSYIYSFNNKSTITITSATRRLRNDNNSNIDLLIVDEAFYLNDNNIINTFRSNIKADGQEWIVGTPGETGSVQRILEDDTFIYQTPTTENPLWNEEMEREFRLSLNAQQYSSEIMAQY